MNLRSRLDFGAPVTLSLATAGGRLSYYSWSWPVRIRLRRGTLRGRSERQRLPAFCPRAVVQSLLSSDPSIAALSQRSACPRLSNAENRMFGPEEWHVVEAFAPAEDIVRRCLALALGDDPMYDANSLTGKSVRPARDVAGSEDALDAVLEVLIDDSAPGRPNSRITSEARSSTR